VLKLAKLESSKPPSPESPSERPSTGSETVLVVEDDRAARDFVRVALQTLGYKVLLAETEEQCIQHFLTAQGKIDLLLSDVIMPKFNGRQLYNNLCRAYPGLKVIFMSGYPADEIGRHGVINEGICFIQKPFSIQELSETVRKAIG
jgi:DNA-binding NtrC family response regulator